MERVRSCLHLDWDGCSHDQGGYDITRYATERCFALKAATPAEDPLTNKLEIILIYR